MIGRFSEIWFPVLKILGNSLRKGEDYSCITDSAG
jgi:hypothetical protein